MCNFTTVVPATEGPTGVITEALTTEEATEVFVTKEATEAPGTEEATTMQPGNMFGYDENTCPQHKLRIWKKFLKISSMRSILFQNMWCDQAKWVGTRKYCF